MSQFYVDPAGLTGLYNQYTRASGDAVDILEYAKRHCDLPAVSEGFLMMVIGPHKEVYDELTTALERLETLTRGAATQVNAAQNDYARTDQSAAERVDALYPGAKNVAVLGEMLWHPRPELTGSRAAFADVEEPSSRLMSPEYAAGIEMWSINPLADLVSPAAWLRQISIWLFDFDPLEGWAKDVGGDWRAYTHCAMAMGHIGAASRDVGANLLAGAGDVPGVWRGRAAEAEQEFQLQLGLATAALNNACNQYKQLYLQAAEAVNKLVDVVAGLITDLIDVLIIINAASAAGEWRRR